MIHVTGSAGSKVRWTGLEGKAAHSETEVGNQDIEIFMNIFYLILKQAIFTCLSTYSMCTFRYMFSCT